MAESLRISQTGIRDLEFIAAPNSSKQAKGTIIQVSGWYPPSMYWVQQVPDLALRDIYNNFSFFAGMTLEQRRSYLLNNSISNDDLYLEDTPNLRIKFKQIAGTFMMSALTPDQINLLLRGNPESPDGFWPIQTVYNMFPRKPGSRARKHTLIFRPSNWYLLPSETNTVQEYNGIYFHIETGSLASGIIRQQVYPVGNVFALVSTQPGNRIPYERMEMIAQSLGLNVEIMRQIQQTISWFSPSVHKSLIQKCIRFRPAMVDKFPVDHVLITSFCMLMAHPGAFVHNIQRFVTGIESALKRLAVSITEDSYLSDPKYISTLYAGALICRQNWFPNEDLFRAWLQVAIVAMKEPRMYDYDWHNTSGMIKQLDYFSLNYYLLQEIGSFPSDVQMCLSIAERQGRPTTYLDPVNDRIMPMIHCIDHHSFTDIAHYFPPAFVETVGSYPELFRYIWNTTVGWNPRKGFPFEENSTVRKAQQLTWYTHSSQPVYSPPTSTVSIPLSTTLKDSWLASFVGPVEFRIGSSTAIVLINPNDITTFTAIKRPSRDQTMPELTETEKSQAIEMMKLALNSGLPLTNVPDLLSMFRGATLTFRNETYWVNGAPWDTIKVIHMTIPQLSGPPSEDYFTEACLRTTDGIYPESNERFQKVLTTVGLRGCKRCLMYLGVKSEIELFHISRDGTGTEYAVNIYDTHVNWVLSAICVLYPSALVKNGRKYRVKSPLFWILTNYIRNVSKGQTISGNVWPIPLPERRQLWEHQKDAIHRLLTKTLPLQVIWIPPGLGKTAIITNYLSELIRTQKMPPYCLYTLPPSALETVQREFSMMGIPFIHLNMIQQAGGPKMLQPGIVNIIYHDHLRLSSLDQIRNIAPEMCFIVDEFHKTLNKTLRTSFALEIARLSATTVVMTGTLIKDTNVEDLIQWIEQSVDFEVTPKNYWVAISGIISRKVQTRVVVERVTIQAEMPPQQLSEYYATVPKSLGGTADRIDFRRAVQISYQAITEEIVRQTVFYLQNGLGVFVVARNLDHQEELRNRLSVTGVRIFCIGKGQSISLTPSDQTDIRVVITTMSHAEGYNMTKFIVMITGVYFSNEATREQMEHRINRIDQISPNVRIVTIHSGIISYIHTKYEKARNLSAALKGFAKDASLEINEADF